MQQTFGFDGRPELIVSILAVLGLIGVGIAAALNWGRSPMARPLALLGAGLSTWTAASLAHEFLELPGTFVPGVYRGWWHYVDIALSPVLPALAYNVVLKFTGQSPARWERLVVLGAVALSIVSGLAAFSESLRVFESSHAWDYVYLAVSNPLIIAAFWRLRVYLRRVVGASERSRTFLLQSALVVGWLFALTEIIGDMDSRVPRLGPLGILVTSVMLTVAVLRFDLLQTRRRWALAAVPLILFSVAFAVFDPRDQNPSLLAATVLPTALILGAFGWPLLQTLRERRQRHERLAQLGRMVAQIAHDIRSPLSSIKGAAQFLLEEMEKKRPLEPHRWFLEEVEAQARRLEQTVNAYGRLVDLRIEQSPTDLATILCEALPHVASRVEVVLDVVPAVISVDADLARAAIENLVLNAVQAMDGEGTIYAGCRMSDVASVWIEDTGHGIPPRDRLTVFEDFWTTKSSGTGLGLPFVRRVMEAHGGFVTLEDGRSGGLRVVLHFARSD